MNKRIAFVIPPFIGGRYFLQPPIGCLWTARLLSNNSIQSELYDLRLSKDPLSIIETLKTGFDYIVYCTSELDVIQNYPVDYRFIYAITLCARIKKLSSAQVIVVGAQGSVFPKYVLDKTDANYVIIGEWELAICDLIVKGNASASRIIFGRAGLMEEDVIPMFELIRFDDYYGYSIDSNGNDIIRGWSIVQSSRGCPYSCTFCYNFYGRVVHYRKPSIVYEELKLQADQGAKYVFFIDSIFGYKKEYALSLCQMLIDGPLDLKLICQSRAGILDSDLLAKMKCAGFIGVWLGIESFDDVVLSTSRKGTNNKLNKESLQQIKESGLIPAAFMMQGLPKQTTACVDQDLKWLNDSGIRFNLSNLLVRPGSPLFNEQFGQGPFDDSIWHNTLFFKGKSFAGDAPSSVSSVHRRYSRQRSSVFNEATNEIDREVHIGLRLLTDSNHEEDCYEIMNFVEKAKKEYKRINVCLFCEDFFSHPHFEEIVKYLNDSRICAKIVSKPNDINQHIAVLSTINGDIKFIIIASKDDKKDEEVTTLLNQLSLLDKSISNDSFDHYMSKRFLECNCRLTLGVSLC